MVQRGKTNPNKCRGYNIEPFDGEIPALEIWRMWNILLFTLLQGPLWPHVVPPDRVPSMGHIDKSVSEQMTDVNLWLLYSNT